MILFQNSIIRLDYNPANDILELAYPNLHDFLLAEIKHSIDIMVDIIRNYDVKRLLIDSSNTTSTVNSEESRDIAVYLASSLVKTRLQRVARVQSLSSKVESTASANLDHINRTVTLPYDLQNFTNKKEAIEWLKR